jgi:hypothetical protein
MEKIESSKNRKEKRRLMAIYNQRQAKIWGSQPRQEFGTATLAKYERDELTLSRPMMDKVWNPMVHGYVDRISFENAMKTEDPTQKGYAGVNPNFGGGTTDPDSGPGSGPKKMKKLTTVLSKNQKLHSMNVPELTTKFEHKLNVDNELRRADAR